MNTNPTIKVTITDDHPMVIDGLRYIISQRSNIEIIDTFNSGAELLEGLNTRFPDVLLLDIQLSDWNGDELIPVLSERYPGIKILAITSIDTPVRVRELIRKGCLGYLLKNTQARILVEAIETVYSGMPFIETSLKEKLMDDMLGFNNKTSHEPIILTRREKEILQMIVDENSSKDIAEKLFISLNTVENHRKHIMEKMDVKNIAGLVKKALMLGIAGGKSTT